MDMSAVDRTYVYVTATATLQDGTAASITGLEGAIVRSGTSPTNTTTWTAAVLSSGKWRLLLAGPFADATGALVVPQTGADLWVRVVDNPETVAVRAEPINIV